MHIKDKEQVKLAIRVPLNENKDLHTALAKLSFSTEYTYLQFLQHKIYGPTSL